MKAQEVGNALYGLQPLEDSEVLRQLTAALIPKVERCGEALKAQHVGSALYGQQRFGNAEESRRLWAALSVKARQGHTGKDAHSLCKALHLLQRGTRLQQVSGRRWCELRRLLQYLR